MIAPLVDIPFMQIVKRHYNEEGTLAGPDQPVDFESDEIRLDIPMEETKINDNWTIVPLIDPVVSASFACWPKLGTAIHACKDII